MKEKLKEAWVSKKVPHDELLITKTLIDDKYKIDFCEEHGGKFNPEKYEAYENMLKAFQIDPSDADKVFANFHSSGGSNARQHAHYHVHRRQPKDEGKLKDIMWDFACSKDDFKRVIARFSIFSYQTYIPF